MRTRTITCLAIAALALSPSLALASPITGSFDISSTPGVTVGLLFTNFLCQTGLAAATCPAPADYGNFSESGSGDFAGLGSGYIHNLSQGTTPAGGGFTLPNFIVFPSAPNIALDLNMIFLGVDSQAGCTAAPAPGQTCTPQSAAFVSAADPLGLSPLNLQNLNGGGSSASFAVAGITRNIATGETSNFNGTFTAQFTTPYQNLLATVLAGGTITNTYSATFTVTAAPVPEPGSMFMMLGGLLVAGSVGLRKLSRRG